MRTRLAILSALLAATFAARSACAYMEAAYTLGKVVNDSTTITVLKVESVDRQKNQIVFRAISDLKGKAATSTIRFNIANAGFHEREWKNTMAWADVGKTAIMFHNGGVSETCLDKYWIQCTRGQGEWWNLYHAEPFLLRTYAGKPERLVPALTAMLAGQEVIVPVFADGDKPGLHLRTGKPERLKASLKLQDYNEKRDFAGWGGVEDVRPIVGMPGFTHYASLGRIGPEAAGVIAADIDGDGKIDLCLYGPSRIAVLQNAGGAAFNEVPLPLPADTGAHSAAWGDWNGDGKPDLLLATPNGPRLFTNDAGKFRDDTALLPKLPYYNSTAVAFLDYDGDGKLDILVADGFSGLRLYRNTGVAPSASPGGPGATFEDVSDRVGLGEAGVARGLKGDHLALADLTGDGRPSFLYSAGTGVLALNTGTPPRFVEVKDSGIAYTPGRVAPVFADFLGDGKPALLVPQPTGIKLFRYVGKGHFTDVTPDALASLTGPATSAAFADLSGTGRLDLVLGFAKGPNRFLRNLGGGKFIDATADLGLDRYVYHTRGLCLADINNDGTPDLLMANEGPDAAALLGNPAKLTPSHTAAR